MNQTHKSNKLRITDKGEYKLKIVEYIANLDFKCLIEDSIDNFNRKNKDVIKNVYILMLLKSSF